ncbi:type II toxin-antitoxin system VapC family toxin [Stappia sp. ES.058]|uniref:type II toxin-antitoxin system VapC family toxin n=1 Tax=Stappia sp. ES.058 TaxID=1881061 RepID=UPI000B870525|nr:type II toxin-antitoxin system VapC family toxin [Stappia sp. ES.058]
MISGRVYLDANVFIVLAEGQLDARRAPLTHFVAGCASVDQLRPCTCEITLAELLVRPFRDGNDRLVNMYSDWISSQSSWLDVGPVSREALYDAALLRQLHPSLKLPDAIHLSAALGFECRYFLTFDSRLPSNVSLAASRHRRGGKPVELKVEAPTQSVVDFLLDTPQ